jgi:hypothetical protein
VAATFFGIGLQWFTFKHTLLCPKKKCLLCQQHMIGEVVSACGVVALALCPDSDTK